MKKKPIKKSIVEQILDFMAIKMHETLMDNCEAFRGYFICAFDPNNPKISKFISNGSKEAVVEMLKDHAAQLEKQINKEK